MTPDDIKRAREIIGAVRKPPWSYTPGTDIDHWELWSETDECCMVQDDSGVEPDTEFIAFILAASTGWPAALDEVEILQRALFHLTGHKCTHLDVPVVEIEAEYAKLRAVAEAAVDFVHRWIEIGDEQADCLKLMEALKAWRSEPSK